MANVPNVPGVPSLSSYITNTVTFLVRDLVSLLEGAFDQSWGVFLDGEQAFDYNSVYGFEYRRDTPISDYPVEEGGFQSYDKVTLPFDVRLKMVSGGTQAERQAMIDSVEQAQNSLELFDVVTPEKTYQDCNIIHHDYKRTSTHGVGAIVFDIWFREVRETSTATFTDTKSANAAGQQNIGTQQAQQPPSSVTQNFNSGQWTAY